MLGAELAPIEGIEAGSGVARYGTDRSMIVLFYRGTRLNGQKSREAGTPIYDPVDRVKIIHPGEKDEMDYVADLRYQHRWPEQWARYKQGLEQADSGTPLALLFPSQPDVVATLNALHIRTIQQLASATDTALGNLPMGRSLQKTAKAYLDKAGDGSEFHALQKQNQEMQADLKRANEQIAALTAAIEADTAEKRRDSLAKARAAKAAKAAESEAPDVAA